MQIAFWIQIALAFFSAGITIFVTWLGYHMSKKEELREEKEQIRQQEREARRAEQEAIKEGIQCILRDRIIQIYDECELKGSASTSMMENMSTMYKAYHALGGNGVATNLFEKFKDIPHSNKTK